ncbi:MAG: serine/threonine protein kinase, partial [Verrucomicrobia bacterium]|nr:serine/threonine protein kinase [Verrucomicrobiota bacterium]
MMVDTNGRLKLADFGISMTVDESRRRGNSNPINGTLGYMSPQQLSGHPAHVTDDIHALGATLYELLTGRRPFHSGDIYAQVISTKPKPLNETLWEQGLTNDIPADVSSLIMACLAKDPSMRPASAKVVAEWLDLKSGEVSGNQFVAQAVGDGLAEHSDSATVPARSSGGLLRKVITRLLAYVVILSVIVTAILISRAKLEEIATGESPELPAKTQPTGQPGAMVIKTLPTTAV